MVRVAPGHIGMPERAGRRQHDKRRIAQCDRHSRQDHLLIESEMHHDRVTRTFIHLPIMLTGDRRAPALGTNHA
jgi:hypothetical protein